MYGAQVSLSVGIGGHYWRARGDCDWATGRLSRRHLRSSGDAGGGSWLSFPYILIAIVWAVTIGSGVLNLVAILAVRGSVKFARVGRGQSLAIRERNITAVRALGGGEWRIMLRHMLPNSLAPILVVAGFQLGRLILLEATLSFLGLGVEPRTPAWGSMLSDARGFLNVAWWTATFPGIAIALVVLAANFMGDSLRDRLDPACGTIPDCWLYFVPTTCQRSSGLGDEFDRCGSWRAEGFVGAFLAGNRGVFPRPSEAGLLRC